MLNDRYHRARWDLEGAILSWGMSVAITALAAYWMAIATIDWAIDR